MLSWCIRKCIRALRRPCVRFRKCVSKRIFLQTYLDGKHVDGNSENQEHCYPYTSVCIFTNFPIQESSTIIVPKLDCVRDCHEFVGSKNSICEPLLLSAWPQIPVQLMIVAHQYIQPTANPTPRSRNLLGNSIIGALTGIKDVISPRQDMTDEMTVPMIM